MPTSPLPNNLILWKEEGPISGARTRIEEEEYVRRKAVRGPIPPALREGEEGGAREEEELGEGDGGGAMEGEERERAGEVVRDEEEGLLESERLMDPEED